MKFIFPRKSIFGSKLLNSKQSIIFAYIFLLAQYFLVPKFGDKYIQIISGSFFLLISNISFIILTFNAFFQSQRKLTFGWFFSNGPLWLLLPIQIFLMIKSVLFILRIFF